MDNKLLYLDNAILNNKNEQTTDTPYNLGDYFRNIMREKR